MSFNLNNVEASKGFSEVPNGEYHVRVAKTDKVTAQNGNTAGNLHMQIVDGPQARRYLFDKVWTNRNASGEAVGDPTKALGRMRYVAEAFGAPLDGFDPYSSLNGLEAIAVTRLKMGTDGKERAEVIAYQPAPASSRDPLATAPRGGSSPVDEFGDVPFAPSII